MPTQDFTSISLSEPARYIATPVEHTLVFTRASGEMINFSLDHFGSHQTLTLSVFDMVDPEQPELAEQIMLSYHEARLLRDLLTRQEVSAILDSAE